MQTVLIIKPSCLQWWLGFFVGGKPAIKVELPFDTPVAVPIKFEIGNN